MYRTLTKRPVVIGDHVRIAPLNSLCPIIYGRVMNVITDTRGDVFISIWGTGEYQTLGWFSSIDWRIVHDYAYLAPGH